MAQIDIDKAFQKLNDLDTSDKQSFVSQLLQNALLNPENTTHAAFLLNIPLSEFYKIMLARDGFDENEITDALHEVPVQSQQLLINHLSVKANSGINEGGFIYRNLDPILFVSVKTNTDEIEDPDFFPSMLDMLNDSLKNSLANTLFNYSITNQDGSMGAFIYQFFDGTRFMQVQMAESSNNPDPEIIADILDELKENEDAKTNVIQGLLNHAKYATGDEMGAFIYKNVSLPEILEAKQQSTLNLRQTNNGLKELIFINTGVK